MKSGKRNSFVLYHVAHGSFIHGDADECKCGEQCDRTTGTEFADAIDAATRHGYHDYSFR